MISEISSTVNIIEKTGRFLDWVRKARTPKADTVSSRFLHLFGAHNIHRNQIPRFFGFGLTIKDMQDDEALLSKLEEHLIDEACSLFGVRREWLEGAESQIYTCHDFYKQPEEIAPFLTELIARNPNGDLGGVLFVPTQKRGESLVVLSEVIGILGEKPIYRYHLCNGWPFEYWRSRAYMTAFVATAWKLKVYIRGGTLPVEEIKQMAEGVMLPTSKSGGFSRRTGKSWDPEDMAIKPKHYLADIDPESDNFGVKAALHLWLELEKDGYMNTELPMYSTQDIRASFELSLRNSELKLMR